MAFLHSNTDLIEQNLKSRPDGLGKKPRIASIKDVQGKFRLASMSSTRTSLARVLFYPIKRLASLGKHVRGYLKALTFLSLPNNYVTLDFFSQRSTGHALGNLASGTGVRHVKGATID